MGFTKVDSGIIDSSLWNEPPATRVVFITMWTKSNRDGLVRISRPNLFRAANVSVEEFDRAILTLESPDPDSRNKDNDGRRIQKVDQGWIILNYVHYRDYSYSQTQGAIRMRKMRKKRNSVTPSDTTLQTVRHISASVLTDQEEGKKDWKKEDPLRVRSFPNSALSFSDDVQRALFLKEHGMTEEQFEEILKREYPECVS